MNLSCFLQFSRLLAMEYEICSNMDNNFIKGFWRKTYSIKDIVDCTGDIILTNYLELIRNIIGTSDKFDSLSIYLKTNVVTKNIEKYEEMSTQNANIIFDMIVEDIIEKEEKGMLDFVNK